MHCLLFQIVGKLQCVIFAKFKAVISLACVILVKCDAFSKESAVPADDKIPACASAFVHPFSIHSPQHHLYTAPSQCGGS